MKTFALCFFILASAALAGESEFFYYYHRQKVPLSMDPTRIAVQIDAESETGKEPTKLACDDLAARLRSKRTDVESVARYRSNGWAQMKVSTPDRQKKNTINRAAADELLTSVTALNTVKRASPIFVVPDGSEIVLTSTILVGFTSEVSDEKQKDVIRSVKGFKTSEQHGRKNHWKLETNHKNALQLLDAVNELALQDGVLYAEPDFAVSVPAENVFLAPKTVGVSE